MNAGEQVLDFLYTTQLQVDDEWAVTTPTGFIWWAAENAQTVEILGEQTAEDGTTGYLIGVRTEMVSDLELTDAALADLNAGPMQLASMSGPVYDVETKTVSLCSLALVHEEIAPWMGMLLSTAAVLQLDESHAFGSVLAERHGARVAVSGHPQRGVRQHADEMIGAAAQIFSPANRTALMLADADFDDAVTRYMMQPPSLGASAGGTGLTVEFPFGQGSSLCQFQGDREHVRWGNGLAIRQRFPCPARTETEGIRTALDLNFEDLTVYPAGYGFGSFCYADGMIGYNGFLPNLLLREGLLPSLYFSCATRALSISVRILGEEWSEESFSPDRSALGRMMREDDSGSC
jgi:hypothetical protein